MQIVKMRDESRAKLIMSIHELIGVPLSEATKAYDLIIEYFRLKSNMGDHPEKCKPREYVLVEKKKGRKRGTDMKLPSGWIARTKIDRKGVKVSVEMSDLILCKDCKYFDYDSTAKVDDIPLIVAHEICNRWGNGCKTREDGWCFLAEQREEQA